MIRNNPGGGTPPPDFTQGGVMDCHPPPETALVTIRELFLVFWVNFMSFNGTQRNKCKDAIRL